MQTRTIAFRRYLGDWARIVLLAGLILCDAEAIAANRAPAVGLGTNKVDLTLQYLGLASGGDGSVAFRRVTVAMARKALDDALDVGIGFVRVAIPGFAPSAFGKRSDLGLWQESPEKYWSAIDQMMEDLDSRGIRLVPVLMWNLAQFPAISRETVRELIQDDRSASWRLLEKYVTDFVSRYRSRPSILFYELSNELNLVADLDNVIRCARDKSGRLCDAVGNFSTDDMIAFTWRFSSLLKGLDPHRLVSSGFSVPRAEAEHLRRNPTWRGTRESWKPDSDKEFGKNIRDIHAGVDIISIHLYDAPRNRRFGSSDALDLVDRAKAAADEAGKPLFIGEFGDPDPTQAEPNSFVDRMLGKVATQRVPYAAVWVWEFYQRGTYLTHDNRHTSFSLEPGRTDYLIGRIRKYNEGVKTSTPSSKGLDVKPPRLVLTWPLDCAVAKEDQIFYAVASDDSGDVERVEFALDGKLLASKDKSPYQLKVEVQDWTPGVHLVEARAFDRSANSASWRTHVVAEPYPSHGECALRQ